MLILIIAAACFTQLVVNSTPANLVKQALGLLYKTAEQPVWKQYLTELLNCALCAGFWIGFIFSLLAIGLSLDALFVASIASVLAELIQRKLVQIKL